MRKEAYAEWLTDKIKPKSIKDRISRCSAVEKALGIDLDKEYKRDGGAAVLKKLDYTLRDLHAGKQFPKEFTFKNADTVVQRMTDLRSATRQYFLFCGEKK